MSTDKKWHRSTHDLGETGEGWRHRRTFLYGPNTEAHVEWNLIGRHSFGFGFDVGRNGMESDLGVDLYAGPVGSVWLRLRSPWTRWLRVKEGQDHWYEARHYGIRIHPYRGCLVMVQLGAYNGMGPKRRRARDLSLTPRTFLGRNRSEVTIEDRGETVVPMIEGAYRATWERRRYTTYHTAPLGRLLDAIVGPSSHASVVLDIPGGIPVEGKGENSWDCGMDGIFGTSGETVERAVANAVGAVLRGRKQYGGPHNLTAPTPVAALVAREAQP